MHASHISIYCKYIYTSSNTEHVKFITQAITAHIWFPVILLTPVSFSASSGSSYLFVIVVFSIIHNITTPTF
jgi:hypothetical protein